MLLIKTHLKESAIPGAGRGLFAADDHPEGTVLGRFDLSTERLYTWEQIKDDAELLDKCYFEPELDRYVFSADDSRFINHSCDRFNYLTNERGENVFVRDVRGGEEILANYCAWPGMDQQIVRDMVGRSCSGCPVCRDSSGAEPR